MIAWAVAVPCTGVPAPRPAPPGAQVELAPGGQDTAVTADNRLAYILRVADYRLNQQIREPAAAFLRCSSDGRLPASLVGRGASP